MRSLLSAAGLGLVLGFCVDSANAVTPKPPSEIRAGLKETISAAIGECAAAAVKEGALGSTANDLIDRFDNLTGDEEPCRWTGNESKVAENSQLVATALNADSSGVELAQLIAAAREVVEEQSFGCEKWECDVANTLKARLDDLLIYVRDGGSSLGRSRFVFNTDTKIFGIEGEEIDPLLVAMRAGPDTLYKAWPARRFTTPVGNLGDALTANGAPLNTNCAPCRDRARELLRYVPVFDVVNLATLPVSSKVWEPIRVEAARHAARWEAYHFGGGSARTPLPWELIINGWIYQQSKPKADREGRIPETPTAPPSWALVVGHPSVGIVPFDSKGAESNVVGVVEVLGYTSWSYDDVTNKRKDEWGVSLAGVYSPREEAEDWAPGVLVRLPFQGLNVVWSQFEGANGEDDDLVALSIDPGKLFGEGGAGSGLACIFGLPMCKN